MAKFDKKEIFSASGGQPTPLTPDAIQTLFKRLSKDTGIHVNPHKFRHTFATRALSAGVDVMALQKALGHTTLAMVRIHLLLNLVDRQGRGGSRRTDQLPFSLGALGSTIWQQDDPAALAHGWSLGG